MKSTRDSSCRGKVGEWLALGSSLACSLWFFPALSASAHAGQDKTAAPPKVEGPSVQDQPAGDNAQPEKLDQIAKLYQHDVEPLLRRACGDCHSKKTELPWYYGVPGVRTLIDSDIATAREHLDISEGFPFLSHSSPAGDLKAIETSIKEATMPPKRYTMMHGTADLTDAEKAIIIKWTQKGQKLLGSSDQP